MAASQKISTTLILLPLRLWVGAILTGSEIIASTKSRDQYEICMAFLRSATNACLELRDQIPPHDLFILENDKLD
ncbi:MAG TPA: hypothetical protein ENI27_00380 [bacterium]|nr:hypothetical protein [bacterium]